MGIYCVPYFIVMFYILEFNLKACIDLIGGNVPSSEYSHNGSWAHLRANQLRNLGIEVDVLDTQPRPADWSEYDTVFIYHGINFHEALPGKQSLNLFGGMTESNAKAFEKTGRPQNDNATYLSLDYEMPDYGALCKARKGEMSDYWSKVDWDRVSERCQNVEFVREPAMYFAPGTVRHLTMGDSHSHSAYRAGSMCLRKDGRTMNGVLKKTLQKEITDNGYDLADLDSLTCYYGNIDIRHHLCRETDPKAALKDMLVRYESALQSLDRPIELVTPVPIEDESRKVPGTGFFKGTPFFGTRAQRMELVDIFKDSLNDMVARNTGWTLFSWPEAWYKMDGVEYMETIMERPRSVHVARKNYRWDLVNNKPNELLIPAKKKSLIEF